MPTVEKRFKALRFIAVLIKIAAFVVAALSVIVALVFIIGGIGGAATTSRNSPFEAAGPAAFMGGFVGGILMLVYGAFLFVILYAYAEVIYLFLGIEENTRLTNEVLRSR